LNLKPQQVIQSIKRLG